MRAGDVPRRLGLFRSGLAIPTRGRNIKQEHTSRMCAVTGAAAQTTLSLFLSVAASKIKNRLVSESRRLFIPAALESRRHCRLHRILSS